MTDGASDPVAAGEVDATEDKGVPADRTMVGLVMGVDDVASAGWLVGF